MKKICNDIFKTYARQITALVVLAAAVAAISIFYTRIGTGLIIQLVVLWLLWLLFTALICQTMLQSAREKRKIEEKAAAKGHYVARISHEMRTPMGAITAMSDIALKTSDPGKIAYCLDLISDASNHLLGIITDVLDMSKIEAGDMEVTPSDFVVAELLNRSVAIVGYDIAEKHQELILNIGDEVPKAIISDMQLLTQVITNLLDNAHRYTPSGGHISVSVEAVRHSGDYHTLRFSVSDNGIGISEEQKSRLLKGAVRGGYASSRLGLDIAQAIIGRLGGKIWVESDPGEGGSRFIFDVEVEEGRSSDEVVLKNARNTEEEELSGNTKFPGKCVLFAEDIEINRAIFGEILEDTGVTVEFAENGREAVAKFVADQEKYDLIFMDIQMPEMDGYVATAKIREIDSVLARNIPIVAMTANVFKEDAEHCLRAGMNAHLGKPFDRAKILRAMQEFFV